MILYDLISFILIHLYIFIKHIKLQPSDSIFVIAHPTKMSLSPKFKYKNNVLSIGEYNKRPFTQIVSEDDRTFYNILIKGKSLQSQRYLDEKKNKSRMSIKQAKQNLKNSLVKNKQQYNLKSNWVQNTTKICKSNNKKEQIPLKRSITVESEEKIKKMAYKNRSIHSAIKKIQQKNSEKIFLQKQISTTRDQNFDKKTHSDFRNIINQFNKVKTEIKQKAAEEQVKKEDKSMRIFYKKPNFYEYQEFYRHNYNMKYLKEEMFLFKKISYAPAPMKNQREKRLSTSQSQKYKIQQRSKTTNEKKKSGVYVLVQSQKSPEKQQKCHMDTFITLQPYLNIKSHEFSKTSRNNIFKRKLNTVTCMNKTFCSQKKSSPITPIENEKIQPWTSIENCDIEQNKLTNIF